MKKILFGCFIGIFSLNVLHANSLRINKTTPHLVLQFSETDRDSIPLLIKELESFYVAISEEFSFSSDSPLHINIYPNIHSFHEALGLVDAPSWSVAKATSDTIDIVSPFNPGSCHSKESITKIMKLNITKAVLFNKFGQNNIPYWLAYGIGAMKINYGNTSHSYQYIPSLTELETLSNNDFNRIGGFQVAYAFAKFIEENFGKETLMDLLSNYESRKEELYQNWIDSLS